MLDFLNVACISQSSFFRHTQEYVFPVIIRDWKKHQQNLLNMLAGRDRGLILAGDGRCNSPGYCAKFGSFTLMEQQLNKVVDFQLVQVCIAQSEMCNCVCSQQNRELVSQIF